MSTSRDSCCLPSVKKQKHDFQVFAFVQCIIKQLLDSVFVISRIIKVSVRVISLRLRLITLTSTLIILDITKTSSNNCLKPFSEPSEVNRLGCILIEHEKPALIQFFHKGTLHINAYAGRLLKSLKVVKFACWRYILVYI